MTIYSGDIHADIQRHNNLILYHLGGYAKLVDHCHEPR